MSERNSAHAEHAHHRKHSSSNKVLRTVTFVLTPFLMLLFVLGVFLLVLLKPYNDVKPYIKLVFSSNVSQTNSDSQVNIYRPDDLELNVKEVEIEKDNTKESHTIIYPYYGDLYATLNIENAGMKDLPVYCGCADDLLEKGVGWFNGSNYIGKVGNVVLAAHNHTYFYLLPQVKEGDIVTLETDYVKMTYIVKQRVIYHKDDLTYVMPMDGTDRLTMFTCWNNGMLGMSDERLGIICDVVSREWKDVEVPKK
ncbi:sortase A [Ruminococcaceae bacterium FB2012]|nr:sortase A [Ruminococcaceae bacterium FB2012]